MGAPSIQQLMLALQTNWSEETSFTPAEWTKENPARGQCLVSTLVIQDYLGGDIRRYSVKANNFKETHYCNILPSEAVFDSTAAQYSEPVQLTITPISLKGHTTARERYIADPDTRTKYELLKESVSSTLSQ